MTKNCAREQKDRHRHRPHRNVARHTLRSRKNSNARSTRLSHPQNSHPHSHINQCHRQRRYRDTGVTSALALARANVPQILVRRDRSNATP